MTLIKLTHFHCRLAIRSWERRTGIKLRVTYTNHGFILHDTNLALAEYHMAKTYILNFVMELHSNCGNN